MEKERMPHAPVVTENTEDRLSWMISLRFQSRSLYVIFYPLQSRYSYSRVGTIGSHIGYAFVCNSARRKEVRQNDQIKPSEFPTPQVIYRRISIEI